jgi:release factor glutamine methyltransferase
VPDGTISWSELVIEVADALTGAGIERPDFEARQIVLQACGASSDEWPTMAADPATKRGVAAIDAMTARRTAGEPLQYVLGQWSFRRLELFVDQRVLIPRPETEIVAGLALAELTRLAPDNQPVAAADLGTGSGAIGLALLTEHLGAEVWLTDASADALAVARANLAGVGRSGARARVAQGSWFEALPEEMHGRFGVIVANPPYVGEDEVLPPEVAEWEPGGALFSGPTGTEQIEHLIDHAPLWLVGDGALVIELSPPQAEPMAERAGARFTEVAIESDLTGRDRALVGRQPRDLGSW